MVHPTVLILGECLIDQTAEIGPYCVIGAPADHRTETASYPVIIGPGVVIRERVSVQRGIERPTIIGHGCYVMAGSYIAHDCQLDEDVTLSAGVSLGGHVTVGRGATLGIHASVHQRRTVGAWSMVGMGAVVVRDVPEGRKVVGVPARDIGENSHGLLRRYGLGSVSASGGSGAGS